MQNEHKQQMEICKKSNTKKEVNMNLNTEKSFFTQKKSNIFILSLLVLSSLLCIFSLCTPSRNILTTLAWDNTLLVVPLFILTSLLFCHFMSTANENVLAITIWQNKARNVQLLLNKGADPRKIRCFYALPSVRVSNLLMQNGEKSMSPRQFLNLVSQAPSERYNEEKQRLESCQILLKQKEALIQLALEKEATQGVRT